MAKKWTIESAKAYVAKVQHGKQQVGLSYYSAVDFLARIGTSVEKVEVESNDNTVEDTD